MPLPKPNDNEEKDKFITRCMGNEIMNEDFPDQSQRRAVCEKQWDGGSGDMACKDDHEEEEMGNKKDKKDMAKTFELTVEIFKTGKWNGWKFDVNDLRTIAISFSNLRDIHKVPLKFGHNDEQLITDGSPAIGWVSEVWVESDTLFARFTDIPEVVYNAISQKMYRHVSVELDFGVMHKNDYYDIVLSGVALLGADIPAVNTLADLTTYLGRDNDLSIDMSKRINFIAEDDKMAKSEETLALEKKLAEAEAREKALMERVKASEAQAKAIALSNKRKDITGRLEELVKANKMTPAQRDGMIKEIADSTENAVFARVESIIEFASNTPGKVLPTNEQGYSDREDVEDVKSDFSSNPSQELADKIEEFRIEHPKVKYQDAMRVVLSRNRKLAKAWAMMNV